MATICDLCGKNIPTKVCAFGEVASAVDGKSLPLWDLCDTCEKRILIKINQFINEARPGPDSEDYLFNKKYNAD